MGEVSTEIWRNESKGIVQVKTLGPNGRLEAVLVQPGRTFSMTREERRLNQMEIATAGDDPWTNDLFSRVGAVDSIVQTAEDVAGVTTRPEQVSATDLFALGIPDLRTQVAEITNPATLKAIYLAGTKAEAKPAKLAVVEARVREVDASADYLPEPEPKTPPAAASISTSPASASTEADDPDAKPAPAKAPAGTRPARP